MKKFTRNLQFKQQQKKSFFARKGKKFKKPRKFRPFLTNLDRFYYGQRHSPRLSHFKTVKNKNEHAAPTRGRYAGLLGRQQVCRAAALLRRFIFYRRERHAEVHAVVSASRKLTLLVSRKYRLKSVKLTNNHQHMRASSKAVSRYLLQRARFNLAAAGSVFGAPQRLRRATYRKVLHLHRALTIQGPSTRRFRLRRRRSGGGRKG